MEPRWPDPPTQLSSFLRESTRLKCKIIHLLELASANLAYTFSKAANWLSSEKDLREETDEHRELMK